MPWLFSSSTWDRRNRTRVRRTNTDRPRTALGQAGRCRNYRFMRYQLDSRPNWNISERVGARNSRALLKWPTVQNSSRSRRSSAGESYRSTKHESNLVRSQADLRHCGLGRGLHEDLRRAVSCPMLAGTLAHCCIPSPNVRSTGRS